MLLPSGVVATIVSASVTQRNVSPSGDRNIGLPPPLIRSTAISAAASGSAIASLSARTVARMKSSTAVGWASRNPRFV
jgi:hypothetical protein